MVPQSGPSPTRIKVYGKAATQEKPASPSTAPTGQTSAHTAFSEPANLGAVPFDTPAANDHPPHPATQSTPSRTPLMRLLDLRKPHDASSVRQALDLVLSNEGRQAVLDVLSGRSMVTPDIRAFVMEVLAKLLSSPHCSDQAIEQLLQSYADHTDLRELLSPIWAPDAPANEGKPVSGLDRVWSIAQRLASSLRDMKACMGMLGTHEALLLQHQPSGRIWDKPTESLGLLKTLLKQQLRNEETNLARDLGELKSFLDSCDLHGPNQAQQSQVAKLLEQHGAFLQREKHTVAFYDKGQSSRDPLWLLKLLSDLLESRGQDKIRALQRQLGTLESLLERCPDLESLKRLQRLDQWVSQVEHRQDAGAGGWKALAAFIRFLKEQDFSAEMSAGVAMSEFLHKAMLSKRNDHDRTGVECRAFIGDLWLTAIANGLDVPGCLDASLLYTAIAASREEWKQSFLDFSDHPVLLARLAPSLTAVRDSDQQLALLRQHLAKVLLRHTGDARMSGLLVGWPGV